MGDAKPGGAEPDLIDRFFAGDIDRSWLRAADAVSRRNAECRRNLQQECRFANAGITTEKNDRARDKATTADPIEFGDAGAASRCRGAGAGQANKFDLPAFGALRCTFGRAVAFDLLHHGIPTAAFVAAAVPFCVDRTAGLADKMAAGARHIQATPVIAPGLPFGSVPRRGRG